MMICGVTEGLGESIISVPRYLVACVSRGVAGSVHSDSDPDGRAAKFAWGELVRDVYLRRESAHRPCINVCPET